MYDENYFKYLKGRSSLSLFYKKHIVYPRVSSRTKGKILDYGCGIGDLISYNKNIIGVDINKYCTDYCVERGFSAFAIENNKLPFDDNEFSTIILDNVFEHLENPEDQFKEIKRVIKNSGALIIGVPGKKGHAMDETHVQFYNEKKLDASLGELGFSLEEFFYTPFFKSKIISKKSSLYVLWGVFCLS